MFRLAVAGLGSMGCLCWSQGGISWAPCPPKGLHGTGVGQCSGSHSLSLFPGMETSVLVEDACETVL